MGRNKDTLPALGITRTRIQTEKARYVELTYTPDTEIMDIPAAPEMPDQDVEDEKAGWRTTTPRPVGPFVGDGAAMLYGRLRRVTRERLDARG